jgi:hypothetical protein
LGVAIQETYSLRLIDSRFVVPRFGMKIHGERGRERERRRGRERERVRVRVRVRVRERVRVKVRERVRWRVKERERERERVRSPSFVAAAAMVMSCRVVQRGFFNCNLRGYKCAFNTSVSSFINAQWSTMKKRAS